MTKERKGWMVWGVAVLATGLIFRTLFPKTIEVLSVPRIVTQYDTVRAVDTAWVVKTRTEVDHDTVFAERVIVAKPDTIIVWPRFIRGITFVRVGEKRGDSTQVLGFSLESTDGTTVARVPWEVRYWTGGPLRTLDADTLPPRISFWEVREAKRCGKLCKVGHIAATAFIVLKVGQLVLDRK